MFRAHQGCGNQQCGCSRIPRCAARRATQTSNSQGGIREGCGHRYACLNGRRLSGMHFRYRMASATMASSSGCKIPSAHRIPRRSGTGRAPTKNPSSPCQILGRPSFNLLRGKGMRCSRRLYTSSGSDFAGSEAHSQVDSCLGLAPTYHRWSDDVCHQSQTSHQGIPLSSAKQ